MNKKYKTQGIILLSIGILLSPAIYNIISIPLDNEGFGLALIFLIPIYLPLAVISIICFASGIGRLITAKQQLVPPTNQQPSNNQTMTAVQQKQLKSNLLALTIDTVLLYILALAMVGLVLYWFRDGEGMFDIYLWGGLPIIIILFAMVMIPLNIKNITKQKKLLAK